MNNKVLFTLLIAACSVFSVKAQEQGILAFKSDFPELAKPLLLKELQQDLPNKAEICFYLGNVYFKENILDSAKYYFDEGLKLDPLSGQNAVGLVMLKMKNADRKALDAELNAIFKQKQNKKDVRVYVAASYAFLYNGRDVDALEYQGKARGIDKKSPLVYILEGDILAPKGAGNAAGRYEMAITYDENCKEAYLKYARIYKRVNADEAIAKLKVLEEKDPNFTLIYRELGDVYYDINKFKEAAECYEKYLKAGHSANIPDLVRYSMTLFFLKDYNKSIEVASSGLATNPRSPALNRLVLYNNFALKNYDLALQAADLLFNNSDGTKITYLDYDFYAKALRETNQYDLAKDEYLKAFALDTTQIEVIKEISEMYSSAKPADLKKSIEYYTQYANKLNGKAGVENIIALGKLYYQQGIDTVATPIADERLIALHNADSVFATAVEKYPENYLGNYWRAAANVALDPETKLGLAKPYYEATIDFALAKLDEEGNRDVRYNGTIIMCYGYLAYYYLLQNDMKSSTDYCNKILELDPNNARAKSTLDYIKSKKK